MKKALLSILSISIALTSFAQDITGEWNGLLKTQAMQLRLVVNISKTNNGYSATMDSPDQGAKGLPVTAISFDNSVLKFAVTTAGIEYEGMLGNDSKIVGNFKQSGQLLPMSFSREKIQSVKLKRPQEPTKPYPYHEEEVTFENSKAGIKLAGTLTLPAKDGSYPAVVLISGSGPQNRNEETAGHKPFLVLSDHLTKNGIAVLRFDDRGTASSKGDFKTATSLDFATDVEAAIKYLQTRKEISKRKIGLIGHSEGGLIAPIVASRSNDVAFIVLLAAPGIPGDEVLLLQQELIGKASGKTDKDLQQSKSINKGGFDIVKKSSSSTQLRADLTNYLTQVVKNDPNAPIPTGMKVEDFVKIQVDQIANPWMEFFLKHDPAQTLAKVKTPVLAITGEKDLQAPPKENLQAIKQALTKGGNKKTTIIELKNLNHFFQESKTGAPNEYATIEQTLSPLALSEIMKWIQLQTKN